MSEGRKGDGAADGEDLRGGQERRGPLQGRRLWAPSIREALALAGSRYPRREVRVVFSKEPEGFLVREPSALAGAAGSKQVHQGAA